MRQQNFPYPVLGNGNDISGEFNPEMTYSITRDFVELKCTFKVTNAFIRDLIKTEKAEYAIEIECGNTFYRKLETTDRDNILIKIPADSLKEKVEVRFYICSTIKIENYHPEISNSVFGTEIFTIEVGDIIAIGGTADFIVSKEFDPLKAPISSIIKLVKSERNIKGILCAIYENDKIIIELSKTDYDTYVEIKNNSVEMLHSVIVLPVLVNAIYEANGGNTSQNYAWIDRLKQICNERQISMDEPLNAAQKILDNPIARTLTWRKKILEENAHD